MIYRIFLKLDTPVTVILSEDQSEVRSFKILNLQRFNIARLLYRKVHRIQMYKYQLFEDESAPDV